MWECDKENVSVSVIVNVVTCECGVGGNVFNVIYNCVYDCGFSSLVISFVFFSFFSPLFSLFVFVFYVALSCVYLFVCLVFGGGVYLFFSWSFGHLWITFHVAFSRRKNALYRNGNNGIKL